jgi:GH35 family endo-1,4-beta-xylanase
MVSTHNGDGVSRGQTRRGISAVVAVAVTAALLLWPALGPAEAGPIPEGTALWFACTEPAFDGPLSLRCPLPYDPRYLATFLENFSRFTPENEFKMAYLEPAEGRFEFGLADQIAAFAQANHKTIRGHTLIWDQQNPWWLTHPLLPWTSAALESVMRGYISTVVGHFATEFPGVVTEWDVVNEPLTDYGALASNPWKQAIGTGYIRLALEDAHAADPDARLLINEDGADVPGPKADALLALATQLKASGAPLDAIGFEAHVTPDSAPSLQDLVALWRRYGAIGLDVEVTELDVGDDGGIDDPAAKAAVFERYADACRLAGNCVGYTVWGVADAYSWLGPNSDALLYNDDFQPSPAASVVRSLLTGGSAAPAHDRGRHRRKRRKRHRS